jgi:hypothetical protein
MPAVGNDLAEDAPVGGFERCGTHDLIPWTLQCRRRNWRIIEGFCREDGSSHEYKGSCNGSESCTESAHPERLHFRRCPRVRLLGQFFVQVGQEPLLGVRVTGTGCP